MTKGSHSVVTGGAGCRDGACALAMLAMLSQGALVHCALLLAITVPAIAQAATDRVSPTCACSQLSGYSIAFACRAIQCGCSSINAWRTLAATTPFPTCLVNASAATCQHRVRDHLRRLSRSCLVTVCSLCSVASCCSLCVGWQSGQRGGLAREPSPAPAPARKFLLRAWKQRGHIKDARPTH